MEQEKGGDAEELQTTSQRAGANGNDLDGQRNLLAKRYAPLFIIGGCYVVFSLLLRLVLFGIFGLPAAVPVLHLPLIILIGIVNDCTALIYLLLPLSLLFLLIPDRLYSSRAGRIMAAIGLWFLLFGLMYLCVAQFFFFQEFDARFNLVAVDYLIYPHEVFVNIWESYPVGKVLILVAVLSSAMLYALWPMVKKGFTVGSSFGRRFKFLAIHTALMLVALAGINTHTLDFSSNRVTNELTADGLSSLFQAFRTNQLDYTQYYRTGDQNMLTERLRQQLSAGNGEFTQKADDLWLNRTFAGQSSGLGKLNVVVIVEESFGCEQVDACGNGKDIDAAVASVEVKETPFLNRLAKKSLFFNRAYATGTRTVRGLEAISASFPPIPSESIIKRPGNEHIATWGKVMRDNGYTTNFLYGGYGKFDNMNKYFADNGFTISDRLDIKNPKFTNIWGVSDQDLFRHARNYFDTLSTSGTPFFSIIMTTSNHSPYTFPPGIPGVPEKNGGRHAGIRYADYALAEFFHSAKSDSWDKNTLFVVVADHGARVYGKAQIPLNSYEIPLLIIAPGRLKPRQINVPISQMDIAPTVLGLLGLPYTAPFFGQNVLAEGKGPGVLLFNHNHDVAMYRDGKLVVLGLQKAVNSYKYALGENTFEKAADDAQLSDLATAYFQTAFNLFEQRRYH